MARPHQQTGHDRREADGDVEGNCLVRLTTGDDEAKIAEGNGGEPHQPRNDPQPPADRSHVIQPNTCGATAGAAEATASISPLSALLGHSAHVHRATCVRALKGCRPSKLAFENRGAHRRQPVRSGPASIHSLVQKGAIK
jgi:hypothetical protein